MLFVYCKRELIEFYETNLWSTMRDEAVPDHLGEVIKRLYKNNYVKWNKGQQKQM
jgi:hypothetical protein